MEFPGVQLGKARNRRWPDCTAKVLTDHYSGGCLGIGGEGDGKGWSLLWSLIDDGWRRFFALKNSSGNNPGFVKGKKGKGEQGGGGQFSGGQQKG